MTNEQIAAFTAFGLLLETERASLLHYLSGSELRSLAGDVQKYLSPQIEDEHDMVTPIVQVLLAAIAQAKS
jgi:hypothetical protein